MDKFQRNYKLTVEGSNGQTVTVIPPFTLEFDIQRNILSSQNTSSFRIYNLAKNIRNSIYKDRLKFDELRKIQLDAGYGAVTPTVFKGNISHSWSVREGVNFISNIEAYDAGFQLINAKTDKAYPKGTPYTSVAENMIKTDLKLPVGAIGKFDGKLPRGATYSGQTVNHLQEITNGSFFVDLEKAYLLNANECIRGAIQVIESASGLLGTPVREETIVNFDMVFEPRLIIGQELELKSITADSFNGIYKVVSIKHRGMISESVCGQAITSVGLLHGFKFTVIN